jgi:hypothetical protein
MPSLPEEPTPDPSPHTNTIPNTNPIESYKESVGMIEKTPN